MADKKIGKEYSSDYVLAGIATSLKEYKLCHHLNRLLKADFKKLDPLVFEPKDRTHKTEFSVFKGIDDENNLQFFVFTNKNLGEYLLPEVSNFDYIVQVLGRFDDDNMKQLLDELKIIPEILMSAEIPVRKIKSRERLVYEEETPLTARYKGHRL